MRDAESGQFAATMRGVFALYRAELSEAVLAIWWGAMKPFDFAAVKDALNRHAVDPDQGRFLPKPADVVRLLGGTTKDAAMIGWSKVTQAMLSVGAYQSVTFDDPLINQVVHDMGGWPYLCGLTQDETPFKGNEFVTRYQGYRMRGSLDSWPAKLLGIADMGNASKGFKPSEPVLIGKREDAIRVLKGGGATPLQITSASDVIAATAANLTHRETEAA